MSLFATKQYDEGKAKLRTKVPAAQRCLACPNWKIMQDNIDEMKALYIKVLRHKNQRDPVEAAYFKGGLDQLDDITKIPESVVKVSVQLDAIDKAKDMATKQRLLKELELKV